MKNHPLKLIFFFASVPLCFCASVLLCLSASSSFASTVVEIPGGSLKELQGKEISKIRVYAANSQGQVLPVPFQIDEKVAGKGPNGWLLNSQPGDGHLDPQDVLLVVAEDAGPRVEPPQLPQGNPRFEVGMEGNPQQVFYVDYEESPSPVSTKSYVQYDPVLDIVTTPLYQAGFSRNFPLIQNRLILKNGVGSINILDRFKIRIKLAIKNFFDFTFNEEEITSQRVGYKAGPIRVVRRMVAYKKLGPIGLIPKSYVDFLFYPDWMLVPSKIQNPVDAPKFLEEKTSGLSGYDFNHNLGGAWFYSNLNSTPLILDGKASGEEKDLGFGVLKWWAVTGPIGSLVVGVHNDPKLLAMGVEPHLSLIDKLSEGAGPEGEVGQIFVGLNLPYHKILKGNYVLVVRLVFPQKFVHGQEENLLAGARTVAPGEVRVLP